MERNVMADMAIKIFLNYYQKPEYQVQVNFRTKDLFFKIGALLIIMIFCKQSLDMELPSKMG